MLGQPEGLRSSAPWAGEQGVWGGEWNATAEGTWEKVWAAGEERHHCWRGREEEGQTTIGISLLIPTWPIRGWGASGAGYGLQEATCSGYERLGTSFAGYGWPGTCCVG